ncbi:MAG: phosphotriesterase-related protein [Actinomycetota bacterium]
MQPTTGTVQTVLGPMAPEDLGVVMTHEHVFARFHVWSCPPETVVEEALWNAPVTLENVGKVRRRTWSNDENLRIDDVDIAVREIQLYAAAGGGTIVEMTPPALGRDARQLRRVARMTGINIVCGTSFYVSLAHPAWVSDASVEDLGQFLLRELTEGIDGTDIRAGVIGEIGTSDPIHQDEEKCLRAGAWAQRRTGAPIEVHMAETNALALEVLDILEREGADLSRVIICHMDARDMDLDYHRAVMGRGAIIEYDFFGVQWTNDDLRDRETGRRFWPPPPSDHQRVEAIATLIGEGYRDQILLSHDTATKAQLVTYGGWGYAHILENIVPLARWHGITADDMEGLLQRNPQRLLAWTHPVE